MKIIQLFTIYCTVIIASVFLFVEQACLLNIGMQVSSTSLLLSEMQDLPLHVVERDALTLQFTWLWHCPLYLLLLLVIIPNTSTTSNLGCTKAALGLGETADQRMLT